MGKTLSARRYANWDDLEPCIIEWGPRGDQDEKHYTLANRSRTVFYTPDVLCRPKTLMDDIHRYQVRIGSCIDEYLHKLDAAPHSMNRVTKLVELLSRLGFSPRYRTLGRDELLFVLDRHWKRLRRTLDPDDFTDAQAIASIERITRGTFRLLERLFPQITRPKNQPTRNNHR